VKVTVTRFSSDVCGVCRHYCRLPLVAHVVFFVSSPQWMDRPLPRAPRRLRLWPPSRPPHLPVPTTAPRPVCRLPKSKSTWIPPPPESIPAPACANVPPPSAPACIPPAPTTAAACAAIRQRWRIPRRTRQHTGTKPPPFVPARRPHARATPTHERTGRDVPAGEAGAAVEALGVACPTTAFARVAAIGPTCAESGVLSLEVRRWGGQG
jgi:hypothetical protein